MLRTLSNRTAMRLNLKMKIISLQHQYLDLRRKKKNLNSWSS